MPASTPSFFKAAAIAVAIFVNLSPGQARTTRDLNPGEPQAAPCDPAECPVFTCDAGFDAIAPDGECCADRCQAAPPSQPPTALPNLPCETELCPMYFCLTPLEQSTPEDQCCPVCREPCPPDECPRCAVKQCLVSSCEEGFELRTPDGLSPSGYYGGQGACCPICVEIPAPDPCEDVDGLVECVAVECDDGFELVTPDGECCPVCQAYCQDVACGSGLIECADGFELVTLDGECCPVCQAVCQDVACGLIECEEGFELAARDGGECCPTFCEPATPTAVSFVDGDEGQPNRPCNVDQCPLFFCIGPDGPVTPPGRCCPVCNTPCPVEVCPVCNINACPALSCGEGQEAFTLNGFAEHHLSGYWGMQGACCPICRDVPTPDPCAEFDHDDCTPITCEEGFEPAFPVGACCPVGCQPEAARACAGLYCPDVDEPVCVSRNNTTTATYENPCKARDCGVNQDDWIRISACPSCGAGFEEVALDGECCPRCEECGDVDEICDAGWEIDCSPGLLKITLDGECCPQCLKAPTQAPTAVPTTSEPTPAPTPAPNPSPPSSKPTATASNRPTPAPTTPDPTPAPTPFTVAPAPVTYCPAGFTNLPERWSWGLGRITIVEAHQDCADRCDQFSDEQYSGGCKGYMTGMYYGMLMCRSYGGAERATACASWANPADPGFNSGTPNKGGNCCVRIPSLNPVADGPWPLPHP